MEENSKNNKNAQLGIGDVSGSFLFDKTMLEKATIKQPEYVMGYEKFN